MNEINEGQTVMSAVTEALKRDKVEKGLYPEDLYLVDYLTKAAKIFKDKNMSDFSRELWGIKIRGIATNNSTGFRMSFHYTVDLPKLENDLKSIIGQTDTFYTRCLGCEIVRYPDRIEVKVDGDNMEKDREYNIIFDSPETFRCMWRQ